MQKTCGRFRVQTFSDGDGVRLENVHNASVSDSTHFNVDDVRDLAYLLECIMNEQSKLAAQRRSAEPDLNRPK